jgi:hypothetical protein
MTLKETHEHVQNIIDDTEHDYKTARKPANKRKAKKVMELFKSIKQHLKSIEK